MDEISFYDTHLPVANPAPNPSCTVEAFTVASNSPRSPVSATSKKTLKASSSTVYSSGTYPNTNTETIYNFR